MAVISLMQWSQAPARSRQSAENLRPRRPPTSRDLLALSGAFDVTATAGR